MEIDVTDMVEEAHIMPELSGSKWELGDDAAKITWNNSLAYGRRYPLLTTDEQRDAAREHFREYGAWSREEIAAWPEEELQAIMCQDVAANIREMDSTSGDRIIYKGDDGRWYYYLGT